MPELHEDRELRALESEMGAVYCLYAGLARGMDAETGLGGELLYVGEPDQAGCCLLRAANIAGAASLAASADAAALRTAMRLGAIDFVVTSLDEALRILKNQIRTKQPVAVGVSLPAEVAVREMEERGVQPDLLAPNLSDAQSAKFRSGGARRIESQPLASGQSFSFVSIPSDWRQAASVFDALLLEQLPAEDHLNRRWLRFAPRYLPAASRRMRLLVSSGEQGTVNREQ